MRYFPFMLRLLALPLLLGPAAYAQIPTSFFGYELPAGGTGPTGVALTDVNRDGRLDCLVLNTNSNGVAVRLGNGAGSFTGTTTVAVGRQAQSLQVADLNQDGNPDFVVLNSGDGSVSVRLGDGQGGFSGVDVPSGVVQATTLVLADATGDGLLDCVVLSTTGEVRILAGDGQGQLLATSPASAFTAPTYTGYYALAVADLNQDGQLDLLAPATGGVQVKLGTGGGVYGPESTVAMPLTMASDVMSVDVNQDGLPDVVAADYMTQSVYVRLNTGNGTYGPTQTVTLPDYPAPVKLADVNGDGFPDLLAAYYGAPTIYYRLGNGTGGFPSGGQVTVGGGSFNGANAFAVGDVNQDGRLDFVSSNNNQNFSVWLNTLLPRRMRTGFSEAFGYSQGLTQFQWTKGNGANRVVFVREVRPGRAPLSEPVDGVRYTANQAEMSARTLVARGTYTLGAGLSRDTVAYLRNPSIGHVYEMAVYEYITDPVQGPLYRRHPSVRYTFTTARYAPVLAGRPGTTGPLLEWDIAAQYKASAFQVERSTDGVSFAPDGQPVAAADSAATARSYSQQSTSPLSGPTYYRVRLTHVDGTTLYSNVVQLAPTPLPVELVAFTGKLRPDGGAQLSWATAQEKSSACFQVERSLSGRTFEPVGRVTAAGNSTQRRDYTFADTRPLGQATYYRLNQVDQDGTEHYSSVVVVSPTGTRLALTCWPNPAAVSEQPSLRLSGLTDLSAPVRFTVRSAVTSQLVASQELSAATTVECTLPATGLAPGVYLIEAQAAEGRWRSKLLVR
jgi:FG-GAP-like repeat